MDLLPGIALLMAGPGDLVAGEGADISELDCVEADESAGGRGKLGG